MFINNVKNWKKLLKIKENLWNELAEKKMAASLLKWIFGDLKPYERKKIYVLKII